MGDVRNLSHSVKRSTPEDQTPTLLWHPMSPIFFGILDEIANTEKPISMSVFDSKMISGARLLIRRKNKHRDFGISRTGDAGRKISFLQ